MIGILNYQWLIISVASVKLFLTIDIEFYDSIKIYIDCAPPELEHSIKKYIDCALPKVGHSVRIYIVCAPPEVGHAQI